MNINSVCVASDTSSSVQALKHVFAGTTKKGVGTQLLAANVVLTVSRLAFDILAGVFF